MDRNERIRYINEVFEHVGQDSILIISHIGQLERLYCPFFVQVIVDVHLLKKGAVKAVNGVKMGIDLVDVYIIESKAYKHYNFIIIGKVNIDQGAR